jgi:hypothetical protein
MCTQVPLREFMAERGAYSGAGTRLLEVAGGTGRFATFLKASLRLFPSSLSSALDLHLKALCRPAPASLGCMQKRSPSCLT